MSNISKALRMAAPYAGDLLREPLQICTSIMQYRIAAMLDVNESPILLGNKVR